MKNARKVKFVVDGPIPPVSAFPERFRDFEVLHHYLQTPTKSIQSRLRKRGRKVWKDAELIFQIFAMFKYLSFTWSQILINIFFQGKWTYIHTIRKVVSQQLIEVKKTLSHRDYLTLLTQEDPQHFEACKTRRCFLWNNQYYQLDIYNDPCHDR